MSLDFDPIPPIGLDAESKLATRLWWTFLGFETVHFSHQVPAMQAFSLSLDPNCSNRITDFYWQVAEYRCQAETWRSIFSKVQQIYCGILNPEATPSSPPLVAAF